MASRTTRQRTDGLIIPVSLTLCTWLVLGGLIWIGHWHLRRSLEEQIAGRDAQAVHALWMSQLFNGGTLEDEATLMDPATQWVSLLETSRLKYLSGLQGIRLFDNQGELITTVPEYVADASLSEAQWSRLRRQLKPSAQFHPEFPLEGIYWFIPETGLPEDKTVPLLDIIIPLLDPESGELLGIAQFLMDGSNIAAEFAELGTTLRVQAWSAFAVGALILTVGIGFAFFRLHRALRLLTERTEDLLCANKELALSAKVSAIGAVTSHLIHGLKSPLTGLHQFMSSQESQSEAGSEWRLAASSTRRIQTLINEVVRVLREEGDGSSYEVTLEELCGLIRNKVEDFANQCDVRFLTRRSGEATLSNRAANLAALISENLIVNALQATPPGKEVRLCLEGEAQRIRVRIEDEGTGIPEHNQAQLFKPCQSSKGGTGIGLAISKQLANYLGATLELRGTGLNGTVFELVLPVDATLPASAPS